MTWKVYPGFVVESQLLPSHGGMEAMVELTMYPVFRKSLTNVFSLFQLIFVCDFQSARLKTQTHPVCGRSGIGEGLCEKHCERRG